MHCLSGKILVVEREKTESLALATEMIHVASILHDDVLDDAQTRRGRLALYRKYNEKLAILGGDYMLAKASVKLASLNNTLVQLCMSNALASMVEGELIPSHIDMSISDYSHKTYCKTAALFMQSCDSIQHLSQTNSSNTMQAKTASFGYHFGMCFQILDDVDDFLNGDDITQGTVTAPVIYSSEANPSISKMFLKKKWRRPIRRIIREVSKHNGVLKTELLARSHINDALDCLETFEDSIYKEALIDVTKALFVSEESFYESG